MELSETFITGLENIESNFKKIRNEKPPSTFDSKFLQELGIKESEAVLLVRLFYDMGLIDKSGALKDSYNRFVASEEESRRFVAEAMREGYSFLFDKDEHAQAWPEEKIHKAFREFLGDKKSDTFIRLITQTFIKLSEYADFDNEEEKPVEPESAEADAALEEVKSGQKEFLDELLRGVEMHSYGGEEHASFDNGDTNGNGGVKEPESKKKEEAVLDVFTSSPGTSPQKEKNNVKHELSDVDIHEQAAELKESVVGSSKSKEFVLKALKRRADLLQKLDRYEESIAAFDQLVAYLDRHTEESNRDEILEILMLKADTLEKMEDYEGAVSAYGEVLNRYENVLYA